MTNYATHPALMPLTEHEQKLAGQAISAELHQRELGILRRYARVLAHHSPTHVTSMAEIRAGLERKGIRLRPGNWLGSVFKEPCWTPTGRWIKCTHRGSHSRPVREWRLTL